MFNTAQLKADLDSAKASALLCSFGKDSLLLLHLCRQLGYDLPIVWFRDGSDDAFPMSVIHDLNLTVYSWQPANLYLLAHDNSAALISEFSLNGELLPMLTDVHGEDGGRCLAAQPRTPHLYLPFDLLLTGYKDCDTHWAADGAILYPEGLVVGGARLIAPLRELTDGQVFDGLEQLGLVFRERDDNVAVCNDCLAGRPLHWDKPLDLTAFRSRVKL